MAQFWEKCTEWPQMTSIYSMVNSTHVHTTYILSMQIFFHSLSDEPFSSCDPIFKKVHMMTKNDLDTF